MLADTRGSFVAEQLKIEAVEDDSESIKKENKQVLREIFDLQDEVLRLEKEVSESMTTEAAGDL